MIDHPRALKYVVQQLLLSDGNACYSLSIGWRVLEASTRPYLTEKQPNHGSQ